MITRLDEYIQIISWKILFCVRDELKSTNLYSSWGKSSKLYNMWGTQQTKQFDLALNSPSDFVAQVLSNGSINILKCWNNRQF